MAKNPAIPKALKEATRGLLFPSETDSPVEAFVWPAGPTDAAGVLDAAGEPPKAKVEEQTLSEFFRAVPAAARGQFFDLLVAVAEHLSGASVFKVGGPKATAYLVGTLANGTRAGVKTVVVET